MNNCYHNFENNRSCYKKYFNSREYTKWEECRIEADYIELMKNNFTAPANKFEKCEKCRIIDEYNDLINALTERLGKGTTTVKKIVKQWINDNLIYKSGNVYKRR
jgi:hypothetical protein